MTRENPLHKEALTCDTVDTGDRIVVYVPQVSGSARRYTVLNTPYTDDDGDMVIDLRREDDNHEVTLLTSEAGLTGGRYDGVWTHIALLDE